MISPVLQGMLKRNLTVFHEMVFGTLEPGTPFEPNWHIEHLIYNLEQMQAGATKRMIFNQPPRSGKSILASIAFPMFVLGHDPTIQIMCVSHTSDLARKFSVDRRRIAQTSWFRDAFPTFEMTVCRDLELNTTRGGGIFSCGMVGAVTGRGADIIIIDDPLKGIDSLSRAKRAEVNAAYDNQISTRLNQKKTGKVLIVMQRFHEDDLVGHVTGRGSWTIITLPAIAQDERCYQLSSVPGDVYRRTSGEALQDSREPLPILEAERLSQGSLIFEAQYQQNPLPVAGNAIRRDWIHYYDGIPDNLERVITSWDTASTLSQEADYSVGTVWGSRGGDYYLLDVRRGKWETPELRRAILALDDKHKPSANLIEDTDIGRAVRQEIERTTNLRLIAVRPRFEKEARLLAQAPRFEAGQVFLPRQAPWLAPYLSELLAFPNGRHDDQVDSTSQALYWMVAKDAQTRPIVRRDIPRRDLPRRDYT